MSDAKHLSGPEGRKHIGKLIENIHICMLNTLGADGTIDSRPMGLNAQNFDGMLWFLTRRESGKVAEIADDAHVTVVFSEPETSKYISMKGRARVSQDRAKIEELWGPMMNAWFPEGKEDPSIAVLSVEVSEANYWEASSSKIVVGIKYLAAAVTHGKVSVGESGKVTF
jgi:general stress protein 26